MQKKRIWILSIVTVLILSAILTGWIINRNKLKAEADELYRQFTHISIFETRFNDEEKLEYDILKERKEQAYRDLNLEALEQLYSEILTFKEKVDDRVMQEDDERFEEGYRIRRTTNMNRVCSYLSKTKEGQWITITIEFGPWIKASETELINAAWKNVGGEGDPLINMKMGSVDFQNGAVFFGHVFIQNIPPVAHESDYVEVVLRTATKDSNGKLLTNSDIIVAYPHVATQYSNKTETSQFSNTATIAIGDLKKSDPWGPVPFMIWVENVFSPNQPDGKPELKNLYFIYGDDVFKTDPIKSFQPEMSWEY